MRFYFLLFIFASVYGSYSFADNDPLHTGCVKDISKKYGMQEDYVWGGFEYLGEMKLQNGDTITMSYYDDWKMWSVPLCLTRLDLKGNIKSGYGKKGEIFLDLYREIIPKYLQLVEGNNRDLYVRFGDDYRHNVIELDRNGAQRVQKWNWETIYKHIEYHTPDGPNLYGINRIVILGADKSRVYARLGTDTSEKKVMIIRFNRTPFGWVFDKGWNKYGYLLVDEPKDDSTENVLLELKKFNVLLPGLGKGFFWIPKECQGTCLGE
jgi:hypothetical protein